MKTIIGMFGVGICIGVLPHPFDILVFLAAVVLFVYALWSSIVHSLHAIKPPEF